MIIPGLVSATFKAESPDFVLAALQKADLHAVEWSENWHIPAGDIVDESLGLIPGFQYRIFFYNADLDFLCSQVVLCIIGGISHQFFAEPQVSVRR